MADFDTEQADIIEGPYSSRRYEDYTIKIPGLGNTHQVCMERTIRCSTE